MFQFFRKSRKPSPPRRCPRHQLGIDNRLENRQVPSTVALADSILTVAGTNGADSIQLQVQSGSSRGDQSVIVRDSGQMIAMFPLSGIKRIQVNGLAGDDKIAVTGALQVPTIIDGGDGNDSIAGGATGAVILGRAGDDALFGGDGRDVIIGGQGADTVVGNGGDDIVIGDSTAADNDPNALFGILEKWNSNLSYADRVKALRPNPEIVGPRRIPDLTLIDDGTGDFLSGGAGQDWFLTFQDKITDREKGEAVM